MRQFQVRWWEVIDGPEKVPAHVEAEVCAKLSERVSDALAEEAESKYVFSGYLVSNSPPMPPLTVETLMHTYRTLAAKVVRIHVGPGQTGAFMSALEDTGALERPPLATGRCYSLLHIPIEEYPYLPAGVAMVTRGEHPDRTLLSIIYFKDGKVTSFVDCEQLEKAFNQAWEGKGAI